MIMAVGLASVQAAMFHLFTHAFFKALLFLGAGAIIVDAASRAEHLEDGRARGHDLGSPSLHFLVGTLALIGCPPFSGFFSKDAILGLAYEKNRAIFWLALFTAFLTAFYMLRLVVVVFFGKPRSDKAPHGRRSTIRDDRAADRSGGARVCSRVSDFSRRIFVQSAAARKRNRLAGSGAGAWRNAARERSSRFRLYRNRESDPLDLAPSSQAILLRRTLFVG